jgi:DNA repair ATPase RecN
MAKKPSTAQYDVEDILFAAAVAKARQQREIEEFLRYDGPGVVKTFRGDIFELARAAHPGKWVRQLLLQRDAEKDHYDEQLAKEIQSIRSISNVALRKRRFVELDKKSNRFYEERRWSVPRDRALTSAQAHDRIDRLMAKMKEEAQRLKKTDEDFQDVGMLADTLAPVVEALKKYEKIAEPTRLDDHPLNELANALFVAIYLSREMGPMIKDREEMARLRAKKAPKVQSKNQVIEALAGQFRRQDPKRSVRSMALKIGPQVGLETNTVEKKLAAMDF